VAARRRLYKLTISFVLRLTHSKVLLDAPAECVALIERCTTGSYYSDIVGHSYISIVIVDFSLTVGLTYIENIQSFLVNQDYSGFTLGTSST
jgi:hypothetical protein